MLHTLTHTYTHAQVPRWRSSYPLQWGQRKETRASNPGCIGKIRRARVTAMRPTGRSGRHTSRKTEFTASRTSGTKDELLFSGGAASGWRKKSGLQAAPPGLAKGAPETGSMAPHPSQSLSPLEQICVLTCVVLLVIGENWQPNSSKKTKRRKQVQTSCVASGGVLAIEGLHKSVSGCGRSGEQRGGWLGTCRPRQFHTSPDLIAL